MKIPFINLQKQYQLNKACLDAAIHGVLDNGQYIMGQAVYDFEDLLCKYFGVNHSITCANGTDAIVLSLNALNLKRNDVVFVPSFTFAATAEAVAYCGGIPFFVDVDYCSYNIDTESLKLAIQEAKKQGLRISGIIAVDLFGRAADYSTLKEIATENNLWLISDNAQGFGATHKKNYPHFYCDIVTTSFFPAKPLGCYGDGGAIFTNNEEVSNVIKSLRIHGKGDDKYDNVRVGQNSRLDTIQAAILIEKLKLFPQEIILTNQIAQFYNSELKNYIQTPLLTEDDICVWAQYTLCLDNSKSRATIMEKLKSVGIPTNIYYPKPLHLQSAYIDYPRVSKISISEKLAKNVFSLPMSAYLEKDELNFICENLRQIL